MTPWFDSRYSTADYDNRFADNDNDNDKTPLAKKIYSQNNDCDNMGGDDGNSVAVVEFVAFLNLPESSPESSKGIRLYAVQVIRW